ncbi:MAG: hypothetical protein HPY81_09370 [Firmicutes bacterium]|nr:hypothetical protein [Bacillota bacterium]
MDLRNCPECGRLFAFVGQNLCPACLEEEEKEFELVREYVREHRNPTITEVSEATGVGADKIIRFLKDGRLIAKGLITEGVLECESCGCPISAGRLCEACRDELTRNIKRLTRPVEKEQPVKRSKSEQKWRTDIIKK